MKHLKILARSLSAAFFLVALTGVTTTVFAQEPRDDNWSGCYLARGVCIEDNTDGSLDYCRKHGLDIVRPCPHDKRVASCAVIVRVVAQDGQGPEEMFSHAIHYDTDSVVDPRANCDQMGREPRARTVFFPWDGAR